MRQNVMKTHGAVLLLLALCILAITQVDVVLADEPAPPIAPIPEPVLEPVAQWGMSAPSMSLSSALLPEQMPTSWTSSQVAVPALANMPILDLPGTQFQPVSQWTKFDFPMAQSTFPRSFDFPDASAYQSPTSLNIDTFVNAMTNAASADARWQSEEQLMQRDLMLTAQMGLDGAFLALDLTNPLEWTGFFISRSNSKWLKTGYEGGQMSGALLTADWGGGLSQIGRSILKNTLLQTPSAQSLSGPFFSSRESTLRIQDPYFQGYSQVSVLSMYQPIFSQNPTGWFVFEDDFRETTITHVTTKVTEGSLATWPGSYAPQYTMPSFQQYTVPSFQQYTVPSMPQITMPSFQQNTMPSVPQITMPPIQQQNW